MIKLEPFLEKDGKYLLGWIHSEEELVQFAGPLFAYPLHLAQIKAYLLHEKRRVFKVVHIESKKVIGMAEIYQESPKIAKLARILIGEKDFRGKGLGGELIHALLHHAFSSPQQEVVKLFVYDWNDSAIRCYTRIGFQPTEREKVKNIVGQQEWFAFEMEIKRAAFLLAHPN
ncbi:MAG: GNAT family N-acetyltransferase [Bacteroidota bacterium]